MIKRRSVETIEFEHAEDGYKLVLRDDEGDLQLEVQPKDKTKPSIFFDFDEEERRALREVV